MADDVIFYPVRGTQATINRLPIKEGWVYFAYDSGNIYIDKDGARFPMGNSSAGIIYAHGKEDDIIKSDPDDETSFDYTFSTSVLDSQLIVPKQDSLILNNDGRFFRVLTVEGNLITARLLAVSGTGGGNSGGGGSIVTYSDRAKLNKQDPESNYLINGKEASIQIYAISGKDYDGSILDEKLTVYWVLSERTSTGILSEYARGNFPIDASTEDSPIWASFEYGTKARQSTENVLTMYAQGSASTASREFSYTFFTSNLELLQHTNFNNVNTYTPSGVTIYCSTVGDLEKIIYYYFENDDGEMILLNSGGTVVPAGTNEQNYTVPESLATHGPHKVRIELYQYINGKPDFTSAATPIEMEIAVVDSNNDLPVIWLGEYNSEYYQYDSIKIPFRVYDSQATLGATITLFKDSTKIGTRTITDTEHFSIWEIVDSDLGEINYYSISCGEDEREVKREISFLVSEDPQRINMKITKSGLRYVFDASGRSNSESAANRVKCVYSVEGAEPITAKFEDFNWYNNGWVTDVDTGNACLRISNGAKFSIPLKFTQFATQNANNQSHTFEFQFKVRNVQDYSQIIHNITRYRGNTDDRYDTYPSWIDTEAYMAFSGVDAQGNITPESLAKQNEYLEWSNGVKYDNYDAFLQWYLPAHMQHYPESGWPPSYDDIEYRKTDKILNTNYAAGQYYDGTHGICIGAQDALFTNGVDTVNVAYVEDKLINLTIVYSHGSGTSDGADKLMSIYLNGMLTGVARSTVDGVWSIGNSNETMNIVFNSQYCDFDLYKIRVYNQALTLPAILVNYTVDLKDPVGYDLTQLAVLNNTLGESQLVYKNMTNYNDDHPDGYIMPYIIFTTKYKDGNALPYSKATPINDVKVEFVNTGLERAYITGELNGLATDAGVSVEDYYMHHCPSWIADHVAMSVQGTSSEFYPRRNYKLKTKNPDPEDPDQNKVVQMHMNRGPFAQQYVEDPASTHLDWFYYDNNIVGTTKFTMKIDYMESSGTYNMGFANLVKNAYSNHPLYDYNKAHAFVTEDPDSTTEIIADEYQPNTSYWYRNHKGNWKEATPSERIEDNLIVTSAEDFAKGPWQLAQEQQLGTLGMDKVKVAKEGEEGYNTWYVRTVGYKEVTIDNINSYRTSVQGFPVLAFHQTTDANGNSLGIKYIGRYNMLLDKGSDEAYGFKINNVYNKFIKDDKGRPTPVSSVAECWEAENNSRGFCSYRDAAVNRAPNDDRFFDTDKLTVYGAPIVADYWEYRYHAKGDSLDVIYKLNEKTGDAKSISLVQSECGVDISDPTVVSSPDNTYTGLYTQGIKNAGDAMLDIYSNWERAVKWVWETNQDNVPSMGVYTPVDIGIAAYEPNLYYISRGSRFVLDNSENYDAGQTYYLDSQGVQTIKLCASSDLVYAPGVYYVDSGLGDYVLDPDTEFNGGIIYYQLISDEEHSGAKILAEPAIYNGKTYRYDTKEYRNAKFVNDLTKHFNLEYLVTYFIMTEVFECYDSRGKNCMVASWGPQEEGGDYIWYPIFYDIDTQLGINNTGIPSFEYYVDATENGTFSTNDSILWNNLYRNFKGAIIQKYRQLKGADSTFKTLPKPPLSSIDRIEKWYLADPEECNSIAMRGERPLIALNLDEYYKYITITNSRSGGGYQNRNGEPNPISYDNGTYFYALQGDRSLSRQQFLINRLNYIDSWLNQGNYERGGTNIVWGRVAANSPSNTSDKWIEGTNKNTEPNLITNEPYWLDAAETIKNHMFDGEYWINMEPVRNSYVTVGTDTANFPSLKYTNLDGPVQFKTPDLENGVRTSGGYHEQLYYIYGIDQMKSLGDMSRLYWTEFKVEGKATKMTDLLLGYDGIDSDMDAATENQHYQNDNINPYSIPASNAATDNGGMPLLKKVNLSYINFNTESPSYNFNSCEKLEDFRAIGSNIQNLTFADGVALKTLYLPSTIRVLNLTEATKLNNIVEEFRERDDKNNIEVKPGLYIPGLTEPENGIYRSDIATINIIGDHLGYDSYKLLNNYYTARSGASASYITITDVDWSPYKQLTEGVEFSVEDANNHLYYIDNGHYSFTEFKASDYTADKWRIGIKNGELYKLDTSIDSSVISSLDLLTNFKTNSKFFSTAAENNTVPYISGIVFIDNETAINEAEIEDLIGSSYPDLKLFFRNITKVPSAKYVILNDDGTYDVLVRKSLREGESFFPNPRSLDLQSTLDKYDTRTQYDFYGWSDKPLSPAGVAALNDEEWYKANKNNLILTTRNAEKLPESEWYDKWDTLSLAANIDDYIFYAVYYIHKYAMTYLDGNGNPAAVMYVPANEYIADYAPSIIPTKDIEDTAENFDQVYKFLGWTTSDAPDALPENWTRENLGRASKNKTYYSVYTKTNVKDNVLRDPSFFEVITSDDGLNYLQLIRPNDISGKVTFPKEFNGKTIHGFNRVVANGNTSSTITHIFWETGSALTTVGTYACNVWPKLVYFELPNSNTTIETGAFSGATKMFNGISQAMLDDWFAKVVQLDTSALLNVGSSYLKPTSSFTQTLLGKTINLRNIQSIGESALSAIVCDNIVFGSETNITLHYTDFVGDGGNLGNILYNCCSVPGGKNNRQGLKMVKIYLKLTTEEQENISSIYNTLYNEKLYINIANNTIQTDILQIVPIV